LKIDRTHILEISELLKQDLPGQKAHTLMAPYQRQSADEIKTSKKEVRHAATMMLLYPRKDEWFFALMLRPDYDGVHGGQVSFPGGKRDPNETPEDNALRELNEEIGVLAKEVKLLGKLSDVYIPPSNMLVNPYVGMLENEPIFIPDEREVERVLEVPLMDLFNDELIKNKKVEVGKYSDNPFLIEVPYFELCYETVWGATALMLIEFKLLFKEYLKNL
jgi:8-oxo-dGTP pyrophosphatase MutT (NUDIX family)